MLLEYDIFTPIETIQVLDLNPFFLNAILFQLNDAVSIFRSGFRYCPTFVGETRHGKVLEAHFIGYQGEDFYGKVGVVSTWALH